MSTAAAISAEIDYPDSDGRLVADNTLQFEWILRLFNGLQILLSKRDDIFLAGNLLWYPVEGKPKIRVAPDVMVAFGRPKGYRGSYKQWVEGGIGPQVVFEVLSPGNRRGELLRKRRIYQRFGVHEYYVYNPYKETLKVYLRASTNFFRVTSITDSFTSPRLGIIFRMTESGMVVLRPDGTPFMDAEAMQQQADAREAAAKSQTRRVKREKRQVEIEAKRAADEAKRAADEARRGYEAQLAALRAKLEAAGIDPDGGP